METQLQTPANVSWFDAAIRPAGGFALLTESSAGDATIWLCGFNEPRCTRLSTEPPHESRRSLLALPQVVVLGMLIDGDIVLSTTPFDKTATRRTVVVARDALQEAGGPPMLAALPDGRFVVAWTQGGPVPVSEDPKRGPYIRIYDQTATPLGPKIRMSRGPAYSNLLGIDIVPGRTGKLVVSWQTYCTRCKGLDMGAPKARSRSISMHGLRLGNVKRFRRQNVSRGTAEDYTESAIRLSGSLLVTTWSPKNKPEDLLAQMHNAARRPSSLVRLLVRAPAADRSSLGYSAFRVRRFGEEHLLVLWMRKDNGGQAIMTKTIDTSLISQP